mmetsp:Transcript_25413/g.101280  ORF Transcript_25413/g.101280 Transcript_25413/m.101280 type:complete len:438 (-) Transcript_25413:112-1425(-)
MPIPSVARPGQEEDEEENADEEEGQEEDDEVDVGLGEVVAEGVGVAEVVSRRRVVLPSSVESHDVPVVVVGGGAAARAQSRGGVLRRRHPRLLLLLLLRDVVVVVVFREGRPHGPVVGPPDAAPVDVDRDARAVEEGRAERAGVAVDAVAARAVDVVVVPEHGEHVACRARRGQLRECARRAVDGRHADALRDRQPVVLVGLEERPLDAPEHRLVAAHLPGEEVRLVEHLVVVPGDVRRRREAHRVVGRPRREHRARDEVAREPALLEVVQRLDVVGGEGDVGVPAEARGRELAGVRQGDEPGAVEGHVGEEHLLLVGWRVVLIVSNDGRRDLWAVVGFFVGRATPRRKDRVGAAEELARRQVVRGLLVEVEPEDRVEGEARAVGEAAELGDVLGEARLVQGEVEGPREPGAAQYREPRADRRPERAAHVAPEAKVL